MATMRAWQFTAKSEGSDSEGTLILPAEGVLKPQIRDDQILVEVYSAALNPHDLKISELATPGMDFCGRVAEVGQKVDTVRVGEMVFGSNMDDWGHGSLAEYTVVTKEMLTSMPNGVKVDDVAGIGCQALTTYEAIQPHVKEGDKVFINGGSGGTGQMSIQMAKALGTHVTTTCSPINTEMCKSLGVDEIINYKSFDVIAVLEESGQLFDLIVDNVGHPVLYKRPQDFLLPGGSFEQIGAPFSFITPPQKDDETLIQGFLSGGKQRCRSFMEKHPEALAQIGRWMQEGKLKSMIDSVFEFDDAPNAWARLKSRWPKGKVVIVHVKKQ